MKRTERRNFVRWRFLEFPFNLLDPLAKRNRTATQVFRARLKVTKGAGNIKQSFGAAVNPISKSGRIVGGAAKRIRIRTSCRPRCEQA